MVIMLGRPMAGRWKLQRLVMRVAPEPPATETRNLRFDSGAKLFEVYAESRDAVTMPAGRLLDRTLVGGGLAIRQDQRSEVRFPARCFA